MIQMQLPISHGALVGLTPNQLEIPERLSSKMNLNKLHIRNLALASHLALGDQNQEGHKDYLQRQKSSLIYKYQEFQHVAHLASLHQLDFDN